MCMRNNQTKQDIIVHIASHCLVIDLLLLYPALLHGDDDDDDDDDDDWCVR